jgi:hypothetical protein
VRTRCVTSADDSLTMITWEPSVEGCAPLRRQGPRLVVRPGQGALLLTGVNGTRGCWLVAGGGGEWGSRRVGEFVVEWVGRSGSRWSTQRLNDLDPDPPTHYASGADATGYPLPW